MSDPKVSDDKLKTVDSYESVYDEIVRKRIAMGAPMAVGTHTAANSKYCKETVEALQATGRHSAADWGIWMMWWRMMDWQTAKQVDEMRLEEIAELKKRIHELETEEQEGWCGHCAGQSCYDAKRKQDQW